MSKWNVGDRVQLKPTSIRTATRRVGSKGTVKSTTIFDMPGFVFVDWDEKLNHPDEDIHQSELEPERLDSPYSAASVMLAVRTNQDRLFAPYAAGRPPRWTCDQRTKDVWCIGCWLSEELSHLNVGDDVRKVQVAEFNRYSRSDENLWDRAASIMNVAAAGEVDVNRKTHRRWG